jgi:hypothetical protein
VGVIVCGSEIWHVVELDVDGIDSSAMVMRRMVKGGRKKEDK